MSTAKNAASSTAPRTASSAAAYSWPACARSTWTRCCSPLPSLASSGISENPASQASMPVTAAATPQPAQARSAASRSLCWAAAPAYVLIACSFACPICPARHYRIAGRAGPPTNLRSYPLRRVSRHSPQEQSAVQNWAFCTPATCMRSHLRGPLFTYGASRWTTSPPAPAPGRGCLPTAHPAGRACRAPPSAKSALPAALQVSWDGHPLPVRQRAGRAHGERGARRRERQRDHGVRRNAQPRRRHGAEKRRAGRVRPVRLFRARPASLFPAGRSIVSGPYMYRPPLTG